MSGIFLPLSQPFGPYCLSKLGLWSFGLSGILSVANPQVRGYRDGTKCP